MKRYLFLVFFLATLTSCAARHVDPSVQAVRTIPLGVALSVPALQTDPKYRNLVAREFDSVTPENAMKMDALYPTRQDFATADADLIVQFARRYQKQVRGHPLVWHRQLPEWLSQLSEAQTNDFLIAHIARVLERYRDDVSVWDVVNEAVNSDGTFRGSLWFARLGPVYIERAFRAAAQHAPHARLFYNDYDLAFKAEKRAAALWLVDALREAGVRVDGIGFQMHLRPNAMPSSEQIKTSFTEVASRGLEVQVTELDVAQVVPLDAAAAAEQAAVYCAVASACLEASTCTGVTVWGLGDAYSWIPDILPGLGAALPFDEQLQPKEAWFALVDGLSAAGCTQAATPSE